MKVSANKDLSRPVINQSGITTIGESSVWNERPETSVDRGIPAPTPISVGSYIRFHNVATGLYIDGMGRTSNGSVCGQWGSSGR
ncbi:MAG: hypothetical protein PVG90_11840 [Bacillota bacterium]